MCSYSNSTKYNAKILQQLNSEFKQRISWNIKNINTSLKQTSNLLS